MRAGCRKVTKRYWYDVLGGFSNPDCFRKHNGQCWQYYVEDLGR